MERWELPKGWGWKRLEDIAPEESRQILPTDYPEQLFNYWGLDAIEKGQIDEPVPNIVSGSSIQSTCVKFTSEHILYCKLRPYLNKVIVPSVEGIGSTEWVPLKPNPEIIERKYLAFVLRSPQFVQYATSNVAGARMPRMSKRALGETKIPIPYPDDPARSLAEQRRIAARLETLLSEARALRAEVQSMRRDLAQVMESALAEAFPAPQGEVAEGWGWKQVSEIVEIHDRGRIPIKESQRIAGNTPYCGANGIIDYVDGHTHEGDFVLLAEDGGNFKGFEQSAYLMSGKFWANNHVHVLRGKEKLLDSKYLYFVLYFSDLTPYLTGATRPKLTQSALQKIIIPIPYPDDPARSLDEQRRIVASLERIAEETRALDASLAQDLRNLEALEQSILAAAFRGEG
jgi:type I restriction enzyme S subunit